MIKMEIKLNEEKILDEGKLTVAEFIEKIDKLFSRYMMKKIILEDGTLSYNGTGCEHDFSHFGLNVLYLKKQKWFMENVTKWLWFNSDDGRTEEDFNVEDILYHYASVRSVI